MQIFSFYVFDVLILIVNTCWVEASAGSGKTTFLLSQLKEYWNLDALCLTFSNAAANEMKTRIALLNACEAEKNARHLEDASSEKNRTLEIMTLHSLAYKIVLEKYPLKQISVKSFENHAILEMLTDSQFVKLVKWLFAQSQTASDAKIESTNCEKLPHINEDLKFSGSIPIFDALCGQEIIDRDELEKIKLVFFTKTGTLRKSIKLPESESKFDQKEYISWASERISMHEILLEKYISWVKNNLFTLIKMQEQKLKDANNYVYYEDLLKIAIEILQNQDNADVFLKFFGNLRLILVDEAQDLSPIQWEFLELILEEWKELDGKLIIASDPKQLIYQFQGANLDSYYKAKNQIKEASYNFEEKFLNYTYRLPKKVCAFVNEVGAQFQMQYQTHETASNVSGDVIFLDVSATNHNDSDNDENDAMKNFTQSSQIVNYIQKRNLDPSKIMILFKQKTPAIAQLAHQFFARGFLINSPYSMKHPIIKDFQYLLKYLMCTDVEDSFALAVVFNAIGKESNLKADEFHWQPEFEYIKNLRKELKNLSKLFYKWISYEPVTKFLQKKLQGGYDFWVNVLFRYVSFYENDPISAISDSNDFYKENIELFSSGIFFNTIHSSKGMEADYVFLLETDAKNKFKNDTESLLYVGITRAKKELIIPLKKMNSTQNLENLENLEVKIDEVFNENPNSKLKDTWAAMLLNAYDSINKS